MSNDYFSERSKLTLKKINAVMDELPVFCEDLFLALESSSTPLTRLNYAYDLRIFFDFISKIRLKGKKIVDIELADVENLSAFDIEKFLSYLGNYEFNGKQNSCSQVAKNRKLATVRTFYKYFFNKDLLSKNTAAKISTPKLKEKEIIRLETDEIVKFLDVAESGNNLTKGQKNRHEKMKKRDLALLSLFLGTGIRISELVGLNISDLDFETYGFTVTRKGGNRTILYFSDEVAEALKDYLSERKGENEFLDKTEPLFLSLQKTRLTCRAVENLVKKYAAVAVPLKHITPHKLRSTFGTQLYRETGDIYQVADCLGHKDVNTTRRHYAAISDDSRRKAASTVKLRKD